MDPVLALVLGVLIAVLAIGYPLLRRRLRRLAQEKGGELGRRASSRSITTALEAMATSVDLATDIASANALVESVASASKRTVTRATEPNTWIVAVSAGPLIVDLVAQPAGVRLSSLQAPEFAQIMQGTRDWQDFSEQVAAAAAERGIATNAVRQDVHVRTPAANGEHVWVRPA
ncbi:hypothetical protein [Burkholderia cenocepacia]|uniref:hypothetical protein n=1 Tax=Burkholderia cenocepacia TaxID=95486 RepID=UPI0038CC01B3